MILETIVIDDDEIFLLISKKIINRSKFHPTPKIFVESIKALDFLIQDYSLQKAYVILIDINMPTLNGWEFLEALRSFAKPQNTFVCVVSSSTDQVDIARADQNPYVLQYLSKPITVETLVKLKELPQLVGFFPITE